MVSSNAKTVEEYLAELPQDRREIVSAIRDLVRKNIPEGYKESIAWGMISYCIPLERYPNTYNKQPLGYVAIASQKNYCSIYLMSVYGDKESKFRQKFEKAGKKLDMGKSCVRFKKLDDLALDVLAEEIASVTVEKYIRMYEEVRKQTKKGK